MKKIRLKSVLLPFVYFVYLILSLVIFFIFRDFFDILNNPEGDFGSLLNLVIASVYVLTWFLVTYFVFKLSRDVFGQEKAGK